MSFLAKAKTGIIIAGIAGMVGFGAGWSVNGWRLTVNFNKVQIAATEAYEAKQKELNAEWLAKSQVDEAARIALSRRLEVTRTRAAQIAKELNRVKLTPKVLNIEGVQLETKECTNDETEITTKLVIANPFSDDFVRLWNTSARGAVAGDDGAE